ncbi:MAG: adenylate/guanylate cyclase domain-containing protein [Actinomycetota bacterium]
MQRRTVGRGLGAVLFTDIVSSTSIAAEIGNSRWSELVTRHHRLIRAELRRFGGREQDTAGDGFFATFERPVDAIRCAVAATEAVRTLGIEIRAGVSFGQLELVEGKAGGLIVNTAARVMSVAGAGEVLVPAAVKDLVPGTGISFDDHGTHDLKGIEGDLRLFRVTEVDGRAAAEPLGSEEAAERRAAIVPIASRRASIIVGGVAAAAVAVVVGVWALAGDDPNPPRGVAPTPLHFAVEFEAETAAVVQRIPYPNPGRPEVSHFGTQMVAGQGAVWVEDSTAYAPTVLRVDPVHGDVERVVVRGNAFTLSLAEGFDAIWVSSNKLIRINPATREFREVLQIPLPAGGSGETSVATDRKRLWIGTAQGILRRVDPTGTVTAERTVTDGIQLIAASEDGVWVVDQLAGVVVRVDPVSLRRVGAPISVTGTIDAIDVLGDDVWALDFGTGLLTEISVTSDRQVGLVTVPAGATSLDAGLGAVWVGHADGTITKVDPVTTTASTFTQVEGTIRALAVDAARGSIWVDVRRT